MKKTDKQSVNITYCPNCGAKLPGPAVFCPGCGNPVKQSSQNIEEIKKEKKKAEKKGRNRSAEKTKKKKGSFLHAAVRVLKNIAGAILTVLLVILLFALTCAVILYISGSSVLSLQIPAFLPESGISYVSAISPASLIVAGVLCAAFIAADILLNLHEAFKFFLQLSIAFFSSGLLAMLFMLLLSSRQFCLFIAAGEIFAGSILLLLHTIALSLSKKKAEFLSDLPGEA